MIRTAALIVGVAALLVGLLWVGQGTGLVRWPAGSFMVADTEWAIRGALMAAVGAFLVWRNRRVR